MTDYYPGDLVEVTATREHWTVDEVIPASAYHPVILGLGRSDGGATFARGTVRSIAAEHVRLVCRAAERTVFPGADHLEIPDARR